MKMYSVTEILTVKQKDKKQYNKNLVIRLLELILTKKGLIFLKLSMKYFDTSSNQIKNSNKIKFQ